MNMMFIMLLQKYKNNELQLLISSYLSGNKSKDLYKQNK